MVRRLVATTNSRIYKRPLKSSVSYFDVTIRWNKVLWIMRSNLMRMRKGKEKENVMEDDEDEVEGQGEADVISEREIAAARG